MAKRWVRLETRVLVPVPVLFCTAARAPGTAPAAGVGCVGLFTEPPLLGAVAEIGGVSVARGLVALLAGIVAGGAVLRRAGAATE